MDEVKLLGLEGQGHQHVDRWVRGWGGHWPLCSYSTIGSNAYNYSVTVGLPLIWQPLGPIKVS